MATKETLKAARLYEKFSGHEAEMIGKVNFVVPKSAVCVGTCDGILYTAVRDGRKEEYIHKFRAKDKPMLCVSANGKQALLIGGNYDFTERGFVDRSSRR